jgi:hypothetical protein
VFFHGTVYAEHYVRVSLSLFFSQLDDEGKPYGNFMNDNTMAHAVNNPVDALDEVFDEQIISQGLWPL